VFRFKMEEVRVGSIDLLRTLDVKPDRGKDAETKRHRNIE